MSSVEPEDRAAGKPTSITGFFEQESQAIGDGQSQGILQDVTHPRFETRFRLAHRCIRGEI